MEITDDGGGPAPEGAGAAWFQKRRREAEAVDGETIDTEAFKRIRIDHRDSSPDPSEESSPRRESGASWEPLRRSSSVPGRGGGGGGGGDGGGGASAPLERAASLPPCRRDDEDEDDVMDYNYDEINGFLHDLHLERTHRRASVG